MADPKTQNLDIERARIDDELKALQLEELQESAAYRRAMREQKKTHRAATEAELADSRNQAQMRQDNCPHRKGGMNMEGLARGNAPNYSVVKHTLSQGGILVLCQRCLKQWMPPVRAEYLQTAEYTQALKDYRRALDFPTDNVPSGSRLFAAA